MAHGPGAWALCGGGCVLRHDLHRRGETVRPALRRFEKSLQPNEMTRRTHRVVALLVGMFILLAAEKFDPSRAKGLDETLRSFADTPARP